MTDRIDTLLKQAAPIDDETVRRLSLDAEQDLLAAIVAEPVPSPAPSRRRPWRTGFALRRPRMAAYAVAAVAAVAAALAGVSLTSGGGVQAGPERAWAAQALRVAEAVPRLALDAPGWTVVRADEFTVEGGELLFEDGRQALALRWIPGSDYDALLAGTEASFPRLAEADVLGQPAVLFGADGVFVAVWRLDGYTFELRTEVGADADGSMSADGFAALVRSLRVVGVDAWLSAMPPTTVLPDARAEAVEGMLSGLPLPPGFVAPAPKVDEGVRDRYQLGADVAGAVACAWIDRWVAARKAGDGPAERAAVDALASSREWPILREMNAEGDYPEAVWMLADAVAGRGPVAGGRDGMTVEGTYREGLGCTG